MHKKEREKTPMYYLVILLFTSCFSTDGALGYLQKHKDTFIQLDQETLLQMMFYKSICQMPSVNETLLLLHKSIHFALEEFIKTVTKNGTLFAFCKYTVVTKFLLCVIVKMVALWLHSTWTQCSICFHDKTDIMNQKKNSPL